MQILDVTIDRAGVFRDPKLPGAAFSNFEQYREFAPERRDYNTAVALYAAEVKPAAIRNVVRKTRDLGWQVTAGTVRESAEDGLRESLLALGYSETEIEWHVANPGKHDRSLWTA